MVQICKINIIGYQQFQDFELDLTYPKEHETKGGEPLEKVCLIGRNGTGKTTLLNLISQLLQYPFEKISNKHLIRIKFRTNNNSYYFIFTHLNKFLLLDSSIDSTKDWFEHWFKEPMLINSEKRLHSGIEKYSKFLIKDIDYQKDIFERFDKVSSNFLLSFITSEFHTNNYAQIKDVPETNLNEALTLFNSRPNFNTINADTLKDFWKLLIYQVKKRDNDFAEFLEKPENQLKSVAEVREEFEKSNPKILDNIAELWNRILEKAGLEFDSKAASNPIQLTDNLKAYIKLKSTSEKIPYINLSAGIRNFIFKVGHLYTLYYQRQIESGLLLIDEPENSLFPDFIYDLIELYQSIIHNTQMIVATHNPIIASQFESYERFILEFDEKGAVTCHRGKSPIGDDANDLLIKDFGIRSILGKKGLEKWERFIELKTLMKHETDMSKKEELMNEFMKIGKEYNFPSTK
jgi:predicted ATP-dependent endonuclease of OLD family